MPLWSCCGRHLHRHESAKGVGAVSDSHDSEELPIQTVSTIGLEIAKSVFQVHGVDGAGRVVKTALRFLLIKPRCFLDKVRNRLLGHPQPRRTEMVAEKIEA